MTDSVRAYAPGSMGNVGPGLDVLYVTSASINLSAAERAQQPWAGAILALDPGVRGLPEARFPG